MPDRPKLLFAPALFLILTLVVPSSWARKKGGGSRTPPPDDATPLVQLNQRLVALEAVDAYQFTTAQIEALQKIAEDLKSPASKVPDPPATKELTAYRAGILELLAAIHEGKLEDAQLEDLKKKVDALGDSAHYEYAAAPEPPEPARKAAADFSRQLRANQLASSISLYAEHVVDPVELLLETAEAKKAAKAANQWPSVRDDAAAEVGYLLAGWDAAGAKAVASRVSAWLEANPDVGSPLAEPQKSAFHETAVKTLGEYDSWMVLRRWTERDLARLLYNPQLMSALEEYDPEN